MTLHALEPYGVERIEPASTFWTRLADEAMKQAQIARKGRNFEYAYNRLNACREWLEMAQKYG